MEVSLDDVSSVIRLVREVGDLWDDPGAWREHLLHGACQLVNGHSGMMLADRQSQRGWFGSLSVIAVVGLPALPLESQEGVANHESEVSHCG